MMNDEVVITASMLRLLSLCERWVWLDQHGDIALQDDLAPGVEISFSLGRQHEQIIQEAAAQAIQRLPVSSWKEGVQVTRDLMQAGAPTILNAYLDAEVGIQGLRGTVRGLGKVDRLERTSLNGRAVYYPIEIKHYTTLQEADHLQLDFYTHLLRALQGDTPDGAFWLGSREDGAPEQVIAHHHDSERFTAAAQRLIEVLRRRREPPVRIEPHCRRCPWYSSCIAAIKPTRPVSLLPGLREATRAHLEQEGIVTLDQFAALEIGEIQRIKGVKTTAAALRANARAFIHSRPIWFERLPDDLRQGGWMLDLETRSLPGEDGSVWCLGWSNESGKAHIVVVAGGREPRLLPFASGQSVWIVPHCDAAWQRFHDSVAADSKPIYHWTGFDAGVMQRTAPPHVREALLPRTHDLHRTLVNTVRLPVRSYSIKAVAHYFGFQWSGYQDWTEAELDYHRWLRLGHEPALERACGYQRDDVIALARVWQWMTAAAPEGDPSI